MLNINISPLNPTHTQFKATPSFHICIHHLLHTFHNSPSLLPLPSSTIYSKMLHLSSLLPLVLVSTALLSAAPLTSASSAVASHSHRALHRARAHHQPHHRNHHQRRHARQSDESSS